MKLSTLLVALPALALALIIAIANRTAVTLSIDPFSARDPVIAFDMPLYVLIFAALLVGVLIGGASAWAGQTGWRRKARKSEREVKHLAKDLERREPDTAEPEKPAEHAGNQKRLA